MQGRLRLAATDLELQLLLKCPHFFLLLCFSLLTGLEVDLGAFVICMFYFCCHLHWVFLLNNKGHKSSQDQKKDNLGWKTQEFPVFMQIC